MTGRPRAAVAGLPAYRPGRSAEAAIDEHGLDHAVKLASNESPWPPLPVALAAVHDAADHGHLYADHRASRLRSALATTAGLDVDRVTVGCGSVGLLQQLALAYVDPRDPVVHARPSFEAYPVYAGLVGAEVVEVPLRRQTIDAEAMAAAVDERTKLLLIASPNNPTGTALDTGSIVDLLGRVPETCVVVLDEAYHEFVRSAAVADSIDLLDRFPNLVVLRTFSKAYGLAALRVGYAFAHPSVIDAVDRTLVPFAVNGPGQAAALASLDEADAIAGRVDGVVAERTRVVRALRELGWSVPDARANFVWLPARDAALDLAHALERRGVVTRPFAGLGVRVTVGDGDANDDFLAAFSAASERLDPAEWGLPTGDLARRVQHTLDELDRAMDRLERHAAEPAPSERLTDADPASGERWDTGQVWAHLAEFGSYWLPELRRIVDHAEAGPAPFGRTKADANRISAIEEGRHRPVADQLETVRADAARLAAELAQLDTADWARCGRHETLGVMDLWRFLDEFAVGHYHQHADQLDGLRRG